MKGFSREEIDVLLEEANKAHETGESLTEVFERVSFKFNRAKGSVRNFYYQLMKSEDKEILEKIKFLKLKVEKNVSFSKTEEEDLVRLVLSEVKKGKSVRRAIIDLSLGDNKKELRIQNKFRNLLKTSPELIEKTAKELNIEKKFAKNKKHKNDNLAFLVKKVSVEIDYLVEKIKSKYYEENESLKKENRELRDIIDKLSKNLGISPLTDYFKINKKTM